jgi:hypothetical protein
VTDLVTFAVLGLMGVRLASGLRVSRSRQGREAVRSIWSRVRWRHVWPVPLVLAGVVLVATPLVQVPGLDWGWWSALGGQGNPVFGSTDATTGTVWEWAIPMVFIALLVPALPLFALAEERMFRAGAEGWSRGRRAVKVVQFGLVHALIGIPIAFALALSVGGAYFMAVYLRAIHRGADRTGATIESATAHTVYNACLIVAVAVTLVVTAVA